MLAELLSGLGQTLDAPGKYLARYPLSGFSNDPRDYESGRGLLEHWGLLNKNRPGLDVGDVAGFAAEQVLDPLNFVSGAGLLKAGRAVGKTLSGLDDFGDIARGLDNFDPSSFRMFQAAEPVEKDLYHEMARQYNEAVLGADDLDMRVIPDEGDGREWLDEDRFGWQQEAQEQENRMEQLFERLQIGKPRQHTDLRQSQLGEIEPDTGFYSKSMRALEGLPNTKPESLTNAVIKGGGSPGELKYLLGREWMKPLDAKGRIDMQGLLSDIDEMGFDWTKNLRVVGGKGKYAGYMPGPVDLDKDIYKELLLIENFPWLHMLTEDRTRGIFEKYADELGGGYHYPLSHFEPGYVDPRLQQKLLGEFQAPIREAASSFLNSKNHFTDLYAGPDGRMGSPGAQLTAADMILGHARYAVQPNERLLLGEIQSDAFQNAGRAIHPLQKDDRWKRALLGSVLREASIDDVNRILLPHARDVTDAVGFPESKSIELYEQTLPKLLEGFGKPYGAGVERLDDGLLGMRLPPELKAAMLSGGIALPALLAMLQGGDEYAP